jgi:hypothetical protein
VFISVSMWEHFVTAFCVTNSATLLFPLGFDPWTSWAVQGLNASGRKILHTSPDQPKGPPNLLYSEYQFIPRHKVGEACFGHPHPTSAEVNPMDVTG